MRLSEDPHAIYMFSTHFTAPTLEEAIELALPTVKACEDFADSLGILCMCDHIPYMLDNELSLRIQFLIKCPQYVVLHKVACLFSFAASHQLNFINQFFYSK